MSDRPPFLPVVLVAVDMSDAADYGFPHTLRPAAIVTVRSVNRARGMRAERIEVTPRAARHPKVAGLLAVVSPCVATASRAVTPLDVAIMLRRLRAA